MNLAGPSPLTTTASLGPLPQLPTKHLARDAAAARQPASVPSKNPSAVSLFGAPNSPLMSPREAAADPMPRRKASLSSPALLCMSVMSDSPQGTARKPPTRLTAFAPQTESPAQDSFATPMSLFDNSPRGFGGVAAGSLLMPRLTASAADVAAEDGNRRKEKKSKRKSPA
jgi:hypothetical protein